MSAFDSHSENKGSQWDIVFIFCSQTRHCLQGGVSMYQWPTESFRNMKRPRNKTSSSQKWFLMSIPSSCSISSVFFFFFFWGGGGLLMRLLALSWCSFLLDRSRLFFYDITEIYLFYMQDVSEFTHKLLEWLEDSFKANHNSSTKNTPRRRSVRTTSITTTRKAKYVISILMRWS